MLIWTLHDNLTGRVQNTNIQNTNDHNTGIHDYIAGKNVRDSHGKFKCGLRIDMDLDTDLDFA